MRSASQVALMSFQSPIHRGNPCIGGVLEHKDYRSRPFSPLFIGAIPASHYREALPGLTDAFSPLFIGAIPASSCASWTLSPDSHLSVPYSSGQSLHQLCETHILYSYFSLSVPYSSGQSLHPLVSAHVWRQLAYFQSPIHRGNPCISFSIRCNMIADILSVPYSSGQSLHPSAAKSRYSPFSSFSPLFIGAIPAS